MKWNAYVLNLVDQGYSPEQIVEEARLPLLTIDYVNDVLAYERIKNRKRNYELYYRPQTDKNKQLYAVALEMGKEAFSLRVSKDRKNFAAELDTTPEHLWLFTQKYCVGMRGNPWNHIGIATTKKKKVQDVIKLW